MAGNLLQRIQFVTQPVQGDRRHYVDEEDVRVVLSRLPEEEYGRLRKVHFNDRSFARIFGYTTTRGRREITLCALPPRISFASPRWSVVPEAFGALNRSQWPTPAVRRFMLYNGLLHEVGHLQLVLPGSSNPKRKFAGETRAQEFADSWRKRLWTEPYDHPDPVHNPPSAGELEALRRGWLEAHKAFKRGWKLEQDRKVEDQAFECYQEALEHYPDHTLALERLAALHIRRGRRSGDLEGIRSAVPLLRRALELDRLLPGAAEMLGSLEKERPDALD